MGQHRKFLSPCDSAECLFYMNLLPKIFPSLSQTWLFLHHSSTPATNQTLPCILWFATPTNKLGVTIGLTLGDILWPNQFEPIPDPEQEYQRSLMATTTGHRERSSWQNNKTNKKKLSLFSSSNKTLLCLNSEKAFLQCQ